MSSFLDIFIEEARDLLADAAQSLAALCDKGFDPDTVSDLFRQFHTIKGGAGFFSQPEMVGTLRVAEDLLGQVRDQQVPMTPEILEGLIGLCDQVGTWLDVLEQDQSLASEPSPETTAMRARLSSFAAANPGTQSLGPAQPI